MKSTEKEGELKFVKKCKNKKNKLRMDVWIWIEDL